MTAPQYVAPEAQVALVAADLGHDSIYMLRDFIANVITGAGGIAHSLETGDIGSARLFHESHMARLGILLGACDYELRRREGKP